MAFFSTFATDGRFFAIIRLMAFFSTFATDGRFFAVFRHMAFLSTIATFVRLLTVFSHVIPSTFKATFLLAVVFSSVGTICLVMAFFAAFKASGFSFTASRRGIWTIGLIVSFFATLEATRFLLLLIRAFPRKMTLFVADSTSFVRGCVIVGITSSPRISSGISSGTPSVVAPSSHDVFFYYFQKRFLQNLEM